jgi:hypothetical protein
MVVLDVLVALAVAVLVTALFMAVYGSAGPWPSFWVFFAVVLLASLAAGLWARPFGPALWGVHWAPFLVAGVLVALVIAAASPPRGARRRPPGRASAPVEVRTEDLGAERSTLAVGTFLWALVAILLIVVVIGALG